MKRDTNRVAYMDRYRERDRDTVEDRGRNIERNCSSSHKYLSTVVVR